MKIAIFDAKEYDKEYFSKENKGRHEITYFEENLTMAIIEKAAGFDAVCGFVNTEATREILTKLNELGVTTWLQRSMGYNKIDLEATKELGMNAYRVPNYSAESVAEHAVSLLMAVNRRLQIADRRTKKFDFSLNGLQGKAIFGSTVGVVGSGKIGQGFIKIMKGMGARVIVSDAYAQEHFPDTAKNLGFEWTSFDEMLGQVDFISIHAPLLPSTKYMFNKEAFAKMKDGVIIINAARGRLIKTSELIEALKSGKVAAAGLDVIEHETGRFFFDKSAEEAKFRAEDPEWDALLSMDNVLVTSHQAFFTEIALTQIAQITLDNADGAEKGDFSKSLQLQEDGKVLNG